MAYELAWDRLDFESLYTLSGLELRDGLDRRGFIAAKRTAYKEQHELGGLVERVGVDQVANSREAAVAITAVELHDHARRAQPRRDGPSQRPVAGRRVPARAVGRGRTPYRRLKPLHASRGDTPTEPDGLAAITISTLRSAHDGDGRASCSPAGAAAASASTRRRSCSTARPSPARAARAASVRCAHPWSRRATG